MGEMSDDLKNLGKNMVAMVNAQKLNALKAGQAQAVQEGATEAEIVGNRYLDVTFSKQREGNSIIDLKQGFAHGASVHHKKNGGWYTKVPISYHVANMTNNTYSQVHNLSPAFSNTTYIKILFGGQPVTDDALTSFGITTKVHGGNLTRINQGATRGSYFAFRTVSDKSSPDSWLLVENMAKEQAEDNKKLRRIGEAIQDTLMSYGKDSST